jgi:hypothetical protein
VRQTTSTDPTVLFTSGARKYADIHSEYADIRSEYADIRSEYADIHSKLAYSASTNAGNAPEFPGR